MFTSGLKECIQAYVKAPHPQCISFAIGLAGVFESNDLSQRNELKSNFRA